MLVVRLIKNLTPYSRNVSEMNRCFLQGENFTESEIREEELPTKVQQRNLIDTGRELCGLIRDVVSEEARQSQNAVQKDVEMMILRARELVTLKQENFELSELQLLFN